MRRRRDTSGSIDYRTEVVGARSLRLEKRLTCMHPNSDADVDSCGFAMRRSKNGPVMLSECALCVNSPTHRAGRIGEDYEQSISRRTDFLSVPSCQQLPEKAKVRRAQRLE